VGKTSAAFPTRGENPDTKKPRAISDAGRKSRHKKTPRHF
jgi:hypothetical protein